MAVYIAGRAALRDKFGSVFRPAIRFVFRSEMKAVTNFFSVGGSKPLTVNFEALLLRPNLTFSSGRIFSLAGRKIQDQMATLNYSFRMCQLADCSAA